ncbi:MAG: hypothetical protein EOP82_16500 [Variovorax sp.]|nr:MAG: hypothetical protein EOP82_16500 [Variovorax sp.]
MQADSAPMRAPDIATVSYGSGVGDKVVSTVGKTSLVLRLELDTAPGGWARRAFADGVLLGSSTFTGSISAYTALDLYMDLRSANDGANTTVIDYLLVEDVPYAPPAPPGAFWTDYVNTYESVT